MASRTLEGWGRGSGSGGPLAQVRGTGLMFKNRFMGNRQCEEHVCRLNPDSVTGNSPVSRHRMHTHAALCQAVKGLRAAPLKEQWREKVDGGP